MKKLLISVASLSMMAGAAFAADLPSRKAAPVYAPPPPMWTGFYAGLNAGYNFGANANVYSQNWGSTWNIPSGNFAGPFAYNSGPISMDAFQSNTQSGFIGGGQVGYNYQYGSNIVLGVEADIQGAGIRGSSFGAGAAALGDNINARASTTTSVGGTAVQGGVDWLGTVRGRIGYLWTPTLLVYGTGGLAYGNAYANVVQSAVEGYQSSYATFQATWLGGGRQNQLLTGWTAGGGVEWMFMPNWSLKAEALYWDMGRMNVNTASYGVSPGNFGGLSLPVDNSLGWGRTSVNYSGVIARAGVNYHFNWGAAPVVARY